MTTKGDICMQCMMCCNGLLYGFVKISAEERSALGDGAVCDDGAPDPDGMLKMKLGCSFLTEDAGCSTYNTRPAKCQSYQCKLLKRVDKAKISVDEAISVVTQMHEQFAALQKLCQEKVPSQDWSYLLAGRGKIEKLMADAKQAGATVPPMDSLKIMTQQLKTIRFMRKNFDLKFRADFDKGSASRDAPTPPAGRP